jgi:hypothetical protein
MAAEQRHLTALSGEPSDISSWELQEALAALASGTLSFGHEEIWGWDAWFGYLAWSAFDPEVERTPATSLRSLNGVVEVLSTAAIVMVSPSMIGFDPDLPGDLLAWLGRAPLRPACWQGGDWSSPIELAATAVRLDPSLSAAMFLVLQHLPPDAVTGWVRSLLDLGGPRWRAHLVCWLAEAWDVLVESRETLASRLARCPALEWPRSEILEMDALGDRALVRFPLATRECFLAAVRAELPAARLLEWCEGFAESVGGGRGDADAVAAVDELATKLFDRLAA